MEENLDNDSITMDEQNNDTESNNDHDPDTVTDGTNVQPDRTESCDDNDEENGYVSDDDDDDDSIGVDDVDLVELWGEESAIEFARNSYCVRLPSSQTRLIDIFLREGHEIVRCYGPGESAYESHDGGEGVREIRSVQGSFDGGGQQLLNENETSDNSNLEASNSHGGNQGWWGKRKNMVKLAAAANRRERSKTNNQILILNQRGDAGEVCNELGTPVDLYLDITDTTTIEDLKNIVHDTWGTPPDKQHFFRTTQKANELQSDTNAALLIGLGLQKGDTIFLRHAKKEGHFQITVPHGIPSIFWPFTRLLDAWLGRECQLGSSFALKAKGFFVEDDEDDKYFNPFLEMGFKVSGLQSLQPDINNMLVVKPNILFGTVAGADDGDHRGFFVHSLDFSLKPSNGKYKIMLDVESTKSRSAGLNISRTSTSERSRRDSGRFDVGLQGVSPSVGGRVGREVLRGTQAQDIKQVSWKQFNICRLGGCHYSFERRQWADDLSQVSYDDTTCVNGLPVFPKTSYSAWESLHLTWQLIPSGDFLKLPSLSCWDLFKLPSVWNPLLSDGEKMDREDKATMIIETRILLRKIHRVKVAKSKGQGKLPKAMWRKQDIDSYREVVIRKEVPLCNFPPTIFSFTSLCKLLVVISVIFLCVWRYHIQQIQPVLLHWLEAAAAHDYEEL